MKRVRRKDLKALIENFAEWCSIHLSEKYHGSPISIATDSLTVTVNIFVEHTMNDRVRVFDSFGREIEKATFGNLKLIHSDYETFERYSRASLLFASNYEFEEEWKNKV